MRILVSVSSALASAETATTTTTKTKKRRTSFYCHNNLSKTTYNTSYSSNDGKPIRNNHKSSKIASIIRGPIAGLKEELLVVAIDPQHPPRHHYHHHHQQLISAISLQIQDNSSSCLFLATKIDKN